MDGIDGVGFGYVEILDEVVVKGGVEEFVDVGVELGGIVDYGVSVREINIFEDFGGLDFVVEEVFVGGFVRRKFYVGFFGFNDMV